MQLSIQGAYPGLKSSDLRLLGWRRVSRGTYQKGDAVATVLNNSVSEVTGSVLEGLGNEILSCGQGLSINWIEVFEALSIDFQPQYESILVGPRVAPQCLHWLGLNLSIILAGDQLDGFQLSSSSVHSEEELFSKCKRLCRSSGYLTQVFKFADDEAFFQSGTQPFSVSGVYPGQMLAEVDGLGWKQESFNRLASIPIYENDNCLYGSVVIRHERSVVVSIHGDCLVNSNGIPVLKSGLNVSPDRHEVFEALGVKCPLGKFIEGYQPTVVLEFKELGLTVGATESIYLLSLKESATNGLLKKPGSFTYVIEDASVHTKIVRFIDKGDSNYETEKIVG